MKLLDPDTYLPLIELAYKEDMGSGDITSQATIPSDQQGSGQVVFRAEGIVCGIGIAQAVLRYYDKSLVIEKQFSDGMQVSSGHAVAAVEGSLRSILAAERVVLNFLQRLSAIATMTAQYVKAVQGTEARKRIDQHWKKFIITGQGVRCVSDEPWVTLAETSELSLALSAMGNRELAQIVFNWIVDRKFGDNTYWCGYTYPETIVWPEEKITWTNAVVLMAADAIYDLTPAGQIFSHRFWDERKG